MKSFFRFLFPHMPRTVTLVVKAESGFLIELDRLAARSSYSRAEIIQIAISLYATALDQAKQGKVISFSYPVLPDDSDAIDEVRRLMIQAEVDDHRKEKRNAPPSG